MINKVEENMLDDVVLEKATIKDLEYIQKLNKKLFVREFEKYNKLLNIEWTFGEKGTKYFKKLIQNGFVYVAKTNNNIIGYLAGSIHNVNECFTEKFAQIENMYIENQYRRLKIGSKLIIKFKEWCKLNNVEYIEVSAWSKNIEAINFYKNNNFIDYKKTLICKLEEKQMENYFIIHGSFSSPYSNWIGWLYDFIEDEGKQVYVPDFPIGVGYQNYENWSRLLKYYLDLGLINENTTIIGHSIAPVFISKFLAQNKVKVKKLIFVCGFNNYLGINEEYDNVNESMYFDNLEDVKQYANEIICFYSDNDPYVKYEVEKDFADKISTEQVFIPNAGHINSESGYDTFEDIVNYI